MAKPVSEMPNTTAYDYANWLDGQAWELEPGVDFHGSISVVRSSLYNQAKVRGLNIVTRTRGGFLYVQTDAQPVAKPARKTRAKATSEK